MGRARKPKAAKLDAVSDAVDNSAPPTESTYDVESPATTRAAKRKAGMNLTSVEESEKEEPHVETLSSKPSSDLQRLEKKIDFLVQSVQAFNSKGTMRPFVKEDQALELNYKSQLFESQKMVDALTMEKHELFKKLESALAKVEVFDQMRDAFGHMKDMMLVSNVTKATDALINFTSQLTSGEGTNPAVTTELNAFLLKETSGQDTIPDVAAKPTASLPPQSTVGQGTSSTVSAEPELWRSKRGRKKKQW